ATTTVSRMYVAAPTKVTPKPEVTTPNRPVSATRQTGGWNSLGASKFQAKVASPPAVSSSGSMASPRSTTTTQESIGRDPPEKVLDSSFSPLTTPIKTPRKPIP